ncbi:MAG: adenosylhomocysteine nucleosidase [Candidatus Pelagisphaera sp.]|jgi:adenosylhomocysteine nucleosidase
MLHFSTALHCEAQGIIAHYGMKPSGGHGRAQFFEGEKARLAITGVGALNSAIATTALGSQHPNDEVIWLNVGICGHLDAPIGAPFIANRISSYGSRDKLYPQLPWKSNLKGVELQTLSEPSTNYQLDQAFDMEGFGFYKAALGFTSTEFIHCIKVVSDNAAQPASSHFDKDAIARMIALQIPAIELLCASIDESRPRKASSKWSCRFTQNAKAQFRFTETETHQLNRRVTQLDAILKQDEKTKTDLLLIKSSNKKILLSQLQLTIDQSSARIIC